ncbi:MAG TPA: ATP-binding cassette domain-containing protein [Nitrosopumilaceae archaeon]|nr:ATP-binding cassette domain-containing protein [Nitrosopumilaceae archaeon]
MYSVETKSLSKTYGTGIKAVDEISITVNDGEIFGFLGPNGAGKSTTIMILTTLLKPTSGTALVAGFDVVTQAKKVRENIGYVQQDSTVDEYLTGRENLILQAKLNHIEKNSIQNRVDEILDLVELSDRQHDSVISYSGGMRKRLDIGGGLLHRPKVLFLDEPTLGLDIQTRYKIWEYIKKIHKEFGMSIFLTTHYMEEADRLCDKISIIDYGKIKITDSPQSMKSALGSDVVVFSVEPGIDLENLFHEIKKNPLVKDLKADGDEVTVFSSNGNQFMPKMFEILSSLGIKIESISLTKPSLDDVFLSHTGRELRDENGGYNRKKEQEKMRRLRA